MNSPRTPHALILPYPAQGHIIPHMELSYRLIECKFRITFINTKFNHQRIFGTMASSQDVLIDGIHFVAIPDGLELEEDRHNFGRLTESLMAMMPSYLEKLMRSNSTEFTYFIVDFNMACTLNIAKNVGLRASAFWPAAAGSLESLFSIPELIRDGLIDKDGAPMKKEAIQLNPEVTPLDTTILPWNCFNDAYTNKVIFNYSITNSQAVLNAEMIICNSIEKLEKPIFNKIPHILLVGPLLPKFESGEYFNLCYFLPDDKQCIAWLDKQPTKSVIYVSFGSITIFDCKQLQELALGLELIDRPFLWVVRPHIAINCTYPLGFEERVADRGRMIKWSPQHKVLKHPAISCFISHCGWNSTIEGVANGVPFLCWPYFADQLFNQHYITKVWKIGLSLVPNENGTISKEEFGSKVEELLKDKDILARSQDLKKFAHNSVMVEGSSFMNLNKLIDSIRQI